MTLKELVAKSFAAVILITVGMFWSGFVVLNIFRTCFRKGYRNVLYWRDRTKEPAPLPYKAWDPETRHAPEVSSAKVWNHAYVTVPESGMRFHYVYTGKLPGDLTISDIDGETVKLSRDTGLEIEKPKLLLCVHGFPENWFSWRYILRYFDEPHPDVGDYFVVAVDTRGYGDSDKPEGYKSYHINNLVCDVRGIAQALGYEKFTLAGHDWGGNIAWNVGKIYPEIIDKLIILNCPEPKSFMNALKRSPVQLLKSWYMVFFQIPYLPELMVRISDYRMLGSMLNGKHGGICNSEYHATEAEIEVFKYCVRHSVTAPINYYRALMWPFAWPGPPLQYPRIKRADSKPLHSIPILVVWGTADAFMGSKFIDIELNPDNGSKVVHVEGASHWVQQDAPKETIQHMVEFLK